MQEDSLHLFTLGSDKEPEWLRLIIHSIGEVWVAMLVSAQEPLPFPGTMAGLCFLGTTPEEAREQAKNFLGHSGSSN